MKKLIDFYICRAKLIGAMYCLVPTILWFGAMFILLPFRGVYMFRLVLSILFGGLLAAFFNDFGLKLWLVKHHSKEGPATVPDGALIGAAIGVGCALIPPLTSLIRSNHIEEAKTFIIVSWLIAAGIGAIMGGGLAMIGRRHIERNAV